MTFMPADHNTGPAQVRRMTRTEGGFPCPICGARTAVIDSRASGEAIRRRRACSNGHRLTTKEEAVLTENGRYGMQLKLYRLRQLGADWLKLLDAALADDEA